MELFCHVTCSTYFHVLLVYFVNDNNFLLTLNLKIVIVLPYHRINYYICLIIIAFYETDLYKHNH